LVLFQLLFFGLQLVEGTLKLLIVLLFQSLLYVGREGILYVDVRSAVRAFYMGKHPAVFCTK
jgi:hypothetical protein